MSTPTDNFPHHPMSPLSADTKPSILDIRLLRKEANANAMAVPSTRGGGAFGHLALCMLAGDYNNIAGTAPQQPNRLFFWAVYYTFTILLYIQYVLYFELMVFLKRNHDT